MTAGTDGKGFDDVTLTFVGLSRHEVPSSTPLVARETADVTLVGFAKFDDPCASRKLAEDIDLPSADFKASTVRLSVSIGVKHCRD